MKKLALPFGIAATAVTLLLASAPAYAQATRTWVSGVGDDANPCSRTAPCKTFSGAISKTAAGGEINCLDQGGFGTVTITKSISIYCQELVGGVLNSGVNGVIIANPNASPPITVLLRGLDMEGGGTGSNGVRVIGTGPAKVIIQNTVIRDNTGFGVDIQAPAGTRVMILDSNITNNTAGGVNVGAANVTNVAVLVRTIVDNNAGFSVKVANTSTVFLSHSKLLGSATALNITAGGTVSSFGDNALQGAGLPTTTPGNL